MFLSSMIAVSFTYAAPLCPLGRPPAPDLRQLIDRMMPRSSHPTQPQREQGKRRGGPHAFLKLTIVQKCANVNNFFRKFTKKRNKSEVTSCFSPFYSIMLRYALFFSQKVFSKFFCGISGGCRNRAFHLPHFCLAGSVFRPPGAQPSSLPAHRRRQTTQKRRTRQDTPPGYSIKFLR